MIFQVSYYLDQYKAVMFDFIANSMTVEASNLSENFPSCQASGLETQGKRGSAPDCGIMVLCGSIFTGFYKNFQHLSGDDIQAIFYERKRFKSPRKSCSERINAGATNSY